MKNDGADDGAAVGFLISTPQTGVDSVLVSMSFFGWPFAIFKMAIALVLGIVGGWLTNLTSSGQDVETNSLSVVDENTCCSSNHVGKSKTNLVQEFVVHSLEVFGSIWLWLLIGIVVSAAINVYFPNAWMERVSELGTWPGMLIVLLISLPLYVCATASVPLAAALVVQGFPPAAAMVFLMAGPASNLATIGAIYGRFGIRSLLIYLSVVIFGSMAGGCFFDWLINANSTTSAMGHIGHHHGGIVSSASSVVVVALFLYFAGNWAVSLVARLSRGAVREKRSNCCQK